jgi:hypothetical protein
MYSYNKGLALVCLLLFRKKSYSISRDFVLMLGRFVESINCRLDYTRHNSNINLKEFTYVGVFVSPFAIEKWFIEFKGESFNNIFYLEEVKI